MNLYLQVFLNSISIINIRRIVIFLMIIFTHLKSESQNKPYNEVSIASPTASSLGKYADIPSIHRKV